MFKFLKKKIEPEGLEKARQLNLITELELLKLKKLRADEKLENYLKPKKSRK